MRLQSFEIRFVTSLRHDTLCQFLGKVHVGLLRYLPVRFLNQGAGSIDLLEVQLGQAGPIIDDYRFCFLVARRVAVGNVVRGGRKFFFKDSEPRVKRLYHLSCSIIVQISEILRGARESRVKGHQR